MDEFRAGEAQHDVAILTEDASTTTSPDSAAAHHTVFRSMCLVAVVALEHLGLARHDVPHCEVDSCLVVV